MQIGQNEPLPRQRYGVFVRRVSHRYLLYDAFADGYLTRTDLESCLQGNAFFKFPFMFLFFFPARLRLALPALLLSIPREISYLASSVYSLSPPVRKQAVRHGCPGHPFVPFWLGLSHHLLAPVSPWRFFLCLGPHIQGCLSFFLYRDHDEDTCKERWE